MPFEINTKHIHIKLGREDTSRTPEPAKLNYPKGNYSYAPLRTNMLPTPSELKQALIAVDTDPRQLMDILRKLPAADMHVLGITETRTDALLGFEYEVKPGAGLEENEVEKKKCDEIKNRLAASNFDECLKNEMNGIIYGHSVTVPHWELNGQNKYQARFETVDFINFAPRNGKLCLIADKSDKEFMATIGDNKNGLVAHHDANSIASYLSSRSGLSFLDLNYEQLIVMHNNPFQGLMQNYIGGLLRPALFLSLLKHFSLIDWAKFNELFGMPLRVGKFDPMISTDKAIQILTTAIKNLGTDAGAVIDNTTAIEFVDAKGGNGSNATYSDFINHIEGKQSILVLGQTLTTEITSKFGSRALGDVHNLVRMDKLWSDIVKVNKINSKSIVEKDYFYNYGLPPNGLYPKFGMKTDEYKDLALMAGVVSDLSSAGLEVSKEWAYGYFDIKGPKDETDKFGGGNAFANFGN